MIGALHRLLRGEVTTPQLMRVIAGQLGKEEKEEVSSIVSHYRAHAQTEGVEKVATRCRDALRKRQARAGGEAGGLELDMPAPLWRSVRAIMAKDIKKERLRSFAKNKRIRDGLAQWPLSWMRGPGVVCYERAYGQIKDKYPEGDGVPPVKMTKTLVRSKDLLTMVGSASDHYVLVEKGKAPRWMTVEENARAMDVPRGSSLMRGLRLAGKGAFTALQATGALGRGIHVGAARGLIRPLVTRGVLRPGMTYGSAWSGIDMFAAAVEEEMGRHWRYEFASEKGKKERAALLASWGEHGLTADRCYADATSRDAREERCVDLFIASPECIEFSSKNHTRSKDRQDREIEKIMLGMAYIAHARPKVAIVENVSDPSVVGPLGGVLRRIARSYGYTLSEGTMDPRESMDALAGRKRHYWKLERIDDAPQS